MSEDSTWAEGIVKWGTKPAKTEPDNLLGSLTIENGVEYEFKEPAEKEVTVDVTEQIFALIEKGVLKITIIGTEKNAASTL